MQAVPRCSILNHTYRIADENVRIEDSDLEVDETENSHVR